MVPIQALLFVAFATSALAASSWDDFANNLATDLTPILQLFGEQVTKQYLAESISILDCIIFAMAPLGVLTAIVSVIRVCGGSTLKAFIGRAQEASGVAELELCSSTGRDIVELYQGGAITRVFGRGKILEIIYDTSLEHAVSRDDVVGDDATATRGIYTFMRYQEAQADGDNWVPSSWPNDMKLSKNREEQRKEIIQSLGYSKNPNLMLNIGLRRHPQWLLVSIAVFGTLLQASMLGFAGWVTFIKKLRKENAMPPLWALSMTAIGTFLLCVGMFMCSHLIDRSTNECTFSRSNPPNGTSSPSRNADEETATRDEGVGGSSSNVAQTNDSTCQKSRTALYCVQPGGQVIGDQTFDSFAYCDKAKPLPHYTMSWRRPMSPWERKMTWVASIVTIVAFIIQFIGLRGLHSSVQVYQLAVVLIMSTLRALLRTKRLDPSDNLFHTTEDDSHAEKEMAREKQTGFDIKGHELDRLAFEIYENRSGEHAPAAGPGYFKYTWAFMNTHAEKEESREGVSTQEGLEQIPETGIWTPKDPEESRIWPWTEKYTLSSTSVWYYRARLGQLTSNTLKKTLSQAWPDDMVEGRLEGRNTAQAISAAASTTLNILSKQKGTHIYVDFTCLSVPVSIPQDTIDMASSGNPLLIRLVHSGVFNRRPLWFVDPADIEAAVSLTLYSCLVHRHAMTSPKNYLTAPEPNNVRRIIAAGAGHNKEAVKELVSQLPLWACITPDHLAGIEYFQTEGVETTTGIATLWTKTLEINEVYTPLWKESEARHGIVQFCGWPVLPRNSTSSNHKYVLATCTTNQSLMTLCAQEVFSSFVYELLNSGGERLKSKFIEEDYSIGIENSVLTSLIDTFTKNDLGSRQDAVFCIVPILMAVHGPAQVQGAFQQLSQSLETTIKQGKWNRVPEVLRWVLLYPVLEPSDDQIWTWAVFLFWYMHHSRQYYRRTHLTYNDWRSCKLMSTLRTGSFSEKAISSIERLADRWYDHPNMPRFESKLQESPYYDMGGDNFRYPIADLIQKGDAYGVLICAYELLPESKKVDVQIPIGIARQRGADWKLVINEITKRRDIFSAIDPKGRGLFRLACSEGDIEAAEGLLQIKYDEFGSDFDWSTKTKGTKTIGKKSERKKTKRKALEQTDDKHWNIFHHMIAENRLQIIEWLCPGMDSHLWQGPARPLFEALGTNDEDIDEILDYLERHCGEQMKAALRFDKEEAFDKNEMHTHFMMMKKGHIISSDKAWIRGLKRVYDFQQKSKTPKTTASEISPESSSKHQPKQT
jgi:hypothetical protein